MAPLIDLLDMSRPSGLGGFQVGSGVGGGDRGFGYDPRRIGVGVRVVLMIFGHGGIVTAVSRHVDHYEEHSMKRLPGLLFALAGVGFALAAVLATDTTGGRTAYIAVSLMFIAIAFMVGNRHR